MLSTPYFLLYLFWHSISHQAPKDFWNNSSFSLLTILWITDFQFISLIYFILFFLFQLILISIPQLMMLPPPGPQGFPTLTLSNLVNSMVCSIWLGATQYTVKINNTKRHPQTWNLGSSVSIFLVGIWVAETPIFAETQLTQENYL